MGFFSVAENVDGGVAIPCPHARTHVSCVWREGAQSLLKVQFLKTLHYHHMASPLYLFVVRSDCHLLISKEFGGWPARRVISSMLLLVSLKGNDILMKHEI